MYKLTVLFEGQGISPTEVPPLMIQKDKQESLYPTAIQMIPAFLAKFDVESCDNLMCRFHVEKCISGRLCERVDDYSKSFVYENKQITERGNKPKGKLPIRNISLRKNKIKSFLVPVVWSMKGYVRIDGVDSEDEAIQKAKELQHALPIPDEGDYLEDSFEIDVDGIVKEV